MFRFVLLLSLLPVVSADICSRVQACAAQLSSYPQLEEDGSGYGSGAVPLYDEVFEASPFDYTQSPDVQSFELCACPGNTSCDQSNEARGLKLDETVSLTFCEDVAAQMPNTCRGHRNLLRVIGQADPSGKTISSVESTVVFCSCASGYHRQAPVSWDGSYLALQYNCN